MIHESILSIVGNTPLVTIRRLNTNPGVKILAKLEAMNPGGSIKDRVGLAMIEAAEKRGEITPDKTIIEATSGNTGIGLAMVCAVKGYKLKLLMPETASLERRRIMQAYGADISLTPGRLATDGAIEEAYRLAREEPDTYVLMDQFNNPASIEAHYRSTGQEIWDQTEGGLTHLVMTLGTSGTAMGCTKRIKELGPQVTIVAVEPGPGHKIQGLKNMQESYPPGIYNKKILDQIRHVEDELAFETCRRLAREEGLFVGMSSGAAMAVSLKLAEELESGTIVTILPDGGERYLSTPLFASEAMSGPAFFDLASSQNVHIAPDAQALGLFTMGPPLDDLGDLGAWRRIVLLDSLGAYLEREGNRVRVLVGLADMDDRALEAARNAGIPRDEFVSRSLGTLKDLANQLGLGERVLFQPGCEQPDTVLELTRTMLSKGAAYEKMRSVYFDVLRFAEYGGLVRTDLDKLNPGASTDLADYAKDNPKDFTLLKRASLLDLKTGDCLNTQWGNVRPSWFLQHAAAAADRLDTLTLFMGEQAHVFPHVENFRAIWSLGKGWAPKIWTACGRVESSDKGASGLDVLLATGASPQALRMWLLSAPYRKDLMADDNVAMWARNQARLQHLAVLLSDGAGSAQGSGELEDKELEQSLVELRASLREAMEDDMALNRFWTTLFAFVKTVNRAAGESISPADAGIILEELASILDPLGVLDQCQLPIAASRWPDEAGRLVAEREAARQAKDFARADALRDQLQQLGYRVEDTPQGARLFSCS